MRGWDLFPPHYFEGTLIWPKIEYREIRNLVDCLDSEEIITEKCISVVHFFGQNQVPRDS